MHTNLCGSCVFDYVKDVQMTTPSGH